MLHRFWPVSDDKISFEYKLKRMLEGSLLTADEAHFFWNGACSPSQIRELCPELRGPNLMCGRRACEAGFGDAASGIR